MNDNNFDQNRFESDTGKEKDSGRFDIYSKQYIPSEDGYIEHKQQYSAGGERARREKAKKTIRRENRKILVAVAVTLAVLLICSAAVLVSAKIAYSYYDRLYQEQIHDWEEGHSSDIPKETEPSGGNETEPEESTVETDLIFSSDKETEIKKSDSEAIATGGAIGDTNLSMADVSALVADSVVEITTSETLRNGLVYESGAGSGVIVNQSGVIITNNHVIEGGTDISVRLTNGNVYSAKLVAADGDSDIAVIKIEPKETLTVAVCGNSDTIVVGEEVLAIGNPLGLLGGTVTNGIVSALEREVTVSGETMTLLQHNAAISPGNSGGALFNMRGELIGIVNAKYSSSGAEGLGFAIPMNTVLEVYDDLIEFGYVKGRADHGLTITTDRYYIFQGYLYIYSSRYTDELKYGDRLLAIGGQYPTSVEEAYALLDQYKIGDTVEIAVVRNSKQITVNLKIQEYVPQN